jgi:hypothetical protein
MVNHNKKSPAKQGTFCCFYFRPRVFSWIFPSLSIVSYFTLFSSLMSFRFRCTRGDLSRAKYRCFRSLFKIPEPCTRFVKRRIRFAVLSWLFFFTSTFVAIVGREYHGETLFARKKTHLLFVLKIKSWTGYVQLFLLLLPG